MTEKRISPESRYDPTTVTKSNCAVTPAVLKWWASLSQQQKAWYCEIHPISELTLGHLGQLVFDGWDQAQMRQYHAQQADDLKLCLIGAVDLEAKAEFARLYDLQLRLAADNQNVAKTPAIDSGF
jgi:hypothetical protein